MIERPIGDLPGVIEPELIGAAACSYACPGCPRSVARRSATVRIIGFQPDLTPELIRRQRPRMVELAGGDLPTNSINFSRLRDAGLRRVIIPLFGLAKDHDARIKVAGAYEIARRSLHAAEEAGLDRLLVFALPHPPRKEWPREEYERVRGYMRMGWAHRAPSRWCFSDELPCFLTRTAYNEIDG